MLCSEADSRRLLRAAGSDERAAGRALARARRLRELLYPIFRAIADGGEPAAELLDSLRDAEECGTQMKQRRFVERRRRSRSANR
jgi:predicted RNA-binding Zn ribbon-like protein